MFTGLNAPLPPVNAIMPAGPQAVIFIVFGAAASGLLVYAIYHAVRWKNALPVLFWLGGLAACMLEPIADMALNALHPPVGQWEAFAAHGYPVPWHIVFAYPFYFGGMLILLWPQIAKRSLSRALTWKLFWGSTLWVALLEQLPVHTGLWIYFGPQPLRIGFMPVSVIFNNTAAVMIVVLVLYRLAPAINTGWTRLIAIPAIALTALGADAAASGLMYDVMGMDLQRLGSVFLNAAAAISILLSILTVWITLEVTQAEPGPPLATLSR